MEEESEDDTGTRAGWHRLCLQADLGQFEMGFPLERMLGQDRTQKSPAPVVFGDRVHGDTEGAAPWIWDKIGVSKRKDGRDREREDRWVDTWVKG